MIAHRRRWHVQLRHESKAFSRLSWRHLVTTTQLRGVRREMRPSAEKLEIIRKNWAKFCSNIGSSTSRTCSLSLFTLETKFASKYQFCRSFWINLEHSSWTEMLKILTAKAKEVNICFWPFCHNPRSCSFYVKSIQCFTDMGHTSASYRDANPDCMVLVVFQQHVAIEIPARSGSLYCTASVALRLIDDFLLVHCVSRRHTPPSFRQVAGSILTNAAAFLIVNAQG